MLRPVVVGLDGSRESLAAADWAAREALRHGLPLRLLQAWEGVTTPGETERPELNEPRRWARQVLADAVDRLGEGYPQLSVSSEQIAGSAYDVLARAGADAELLVLGSRAFGGLGGFLVGSVAQATVAHVTRPVVLVRAHHSLADEHLPDADGRPSAHTPYRDVVVGVDPAHACEELLSFAFECAALRDAPLRAVSVWRLPYVQGAAVARARKAIQASAAHTLAAVVEPWRQKFPTVEVHELTREGSPAQRLPAFAQDAGLLVVGRRIRSSRLGTHTGPVAHAAMHHARCPVVVVAHA
ncbi:universal stress protein [Streptomyces sp. S.PB5]|uniref:universal stress protein n=1 Tax=Streptomyces sp. S.PB5 TaxID=3020844 RepID=UPI0025B1238B|nr:universal stress protein [Streptomyces sp. S.PB5]MDN3027923.1 universal stress protein [Streptomyces sp. S.PB5]